MAWRLTEAEKLINEIQLMRAEMAALKAQNERLRLMLNKLYLAGLLGGLDKTYPDFMTEIQQCLKDGEE